jgi:hypothetical protein
MGVALELAKLSAVAWLGHTSTGIRRDSVILRMALGALDVMSVPRAPSAVGGAREAVPTPEFR